MWREARITYRKSSGPVRLLILRHEHLLAEAQLEAIEEAFGRALVAAHRLQVVEEASPPTASLRH